jgi:ArsR family transcriptional regulator
MYETIFKLQAKTLKALAHSRRLEIIQLLHDGELPVTDIYQMLDLPQANVSQHLTVLKSAGILNSRKNGKQIYYGLADPVFIKVIHHLRELLIGQYKNSQLADEIALTMNDLVPVTHDPVCHMRLSPKTASFALKHDQQTFYFCASGCYQSFRQNPAAYAH